MEQHEKVSGYLEKKTRKKMVSSYKKYWFVLEGRLLLYYKSKDEYDGISPCKGSINLGPTSSVKPGTTNNAFQIESNTTTITLRAENRDEQHKWMEALMVALNQKNDYKKLNHFRYSHKKELDGSIIEKLQKMGAKSYGIGPKLQRSKTTLSNDTRYQKTTSMFIDKNLYEPIMVRRGNSVESVEVSSDGLYERISSNDSVFIEGKSSVQNIEDDYQAIDFNDNQIVQQKAEENVYDEVEEVDYKGLFVFKKKSKSLKVKPNLKKSESFLQRMWSRNKPKKKLEISLSANNIETIQSSKEITTKREEFMKIDQKIKPLQLKQSTENPMEIMVTKERPINLICPSLPPRNKGVKPPPPVVPPKKKSKLLLLDEVDSTPTNKVRELIKKFDVEEAVELRPKKIEDLDQLLNDLAKITTAPLMTPGVTTSLINPEISDRELQKMAPQRRRRLSEPDYDIPRPHRSLINLQKKNDNVLEATRFFGPILKPSDFEDQPVTPSTDHVLSITPDSLEVIDTKTEASHEELRNYSYNSHDYMRYNRQDAVVYDDPRFLVNSRLDHSPESHDVTLRSTYFDHLFVDSLDS